MHLLLTGSTGRVGRHTLAHLLSEGHTVVATDVAPPSASAPLPTSEQYVFVTADLASVPAVDALFDTPPPSSAKARSAEQPPFDGVIHLGAIPNPRPDLDDRLLHNNNVTSSYNVLRTAVDRGVTRITQASSVNAHGISYAPKGHTVFDRFPIDEDVERRDEDAYATSKHISEIQADALVRWARESGVRIASLRFHMVKDDYDDAWPLCTVRDLFSWVSYSASARACLLGITSEGWAGHEVFNIVAPEICWEGSVDRQRKVGEPQGEQPGTLELVRRYITYPVTLDEEYFRKRPRAALWVSTKAERMLGWKHE